MLEEACDFVLVDYINPVNFFFLNLLMHNG